MATLVLTTVGSLLGGPVGGALGAFAGRQIDGALFRSGSVQGPRVKDLTATTSSYGQPISRHFGQMRVPGTIIWATDLQETKEKSGGGKGKPKTTTYSYSASFAVALSSRPIQSIGRIWADGKLLRGTAGDLKTAGSFRLYSGYEDQASDPLLAADTNGTAPAFRGCAYVVFEDLQLGDFGNRIPALTFEVFADQVPEVALDQLVPFAQLPNGNSILQHMQGFSDEGGSLLASLEAIKRVYPVSCVTSGDTLELHQLDVPATNVPILPPSLLSIDDENQRVGAGELHKRSSATNAVPHAVRYYDIERDYQPGVQRAIGRPAPGREITLDLPGALYPVGARSLVNIQALTSNWKTETLNWRLAELDLAYSPGSIVSVPGKSGIWSIVSTEWSEQGIDLELSRISPTTHINVVADPGSINHPIDLPNWPSVLHAFELPWDGTGSPEASGYFAAVSAYGENWTGASLYIDQVGTLIPTNLFTKDRSLIGDLATPLSSSSATYFDKDASIEIELAGEGFLLGSTTMAGLAMGANRMLVDQELIQFAHASQLTSTRWQLSGLLRGRGGTEAQALEGHIAGVKITVIDDSLQLLDPLLLTANGTTQIAAIGLGDNEPAYATLNATGISKRPPAPVHPKVVVSANGDWTLSWVRRGRGQWRWEDYVDTLLVEETELSLVGIGDIQSPAISWQTPDPSFTIDAATLSSLSAQQAGANVWVQQLGAYGPSQSILLAQIP